MPDAAAGPVGYLAAVERRGLDRTSASEADGLQPPWSPLLVAAPTCSSLLVRSLTDMGNPKQAAVCTAL